MNQDETQPSREALEARITALLLGEVSPGEEAALRQRLAGDAELAALHDRLARSLGLVREAVGEIPAQGAAASDARARMSLARRSLLLERLRSAGAGSEGVEGGSPAPVSGPEDRTPEVIVTERVTPLRRRDSGMLLALAACLVGLLVLTTLSITLPSMAKAKAKGARVARMDVEPAPPASLADSFAYVATAAATEAGEVQNGPGGARVEGFGRLGGATRHADESLAEPVPARQLMVRSIRTNAGLMSVPAEPPMPVPAAAPVAPAAASEPTTFSMSPQLMRRYGLAAAGSAGGGGLGGGGGGQFVPPPAPAPSVRGQLSREMAGRPAAGVEVEARKRVAGEETAVTRDRARSLAEPTVEVEVAQRVAPVALDANTVDFGVPTKSKAVAESLERRADKPGMAAPVVTFFDSDADALVPRLERESDDGLAAQRGASVPGLALLARDAVAKPVAGESPFQPEQAAAEERYSTFSLNVSDVSFRLAQASLDAGQLPAPAQVRPEEFLNALDYRDPQPAPGLPVGFTWERARHSMVHNRDVLRLSVQTAAAGRETGRSLNVVLLLDNSGSMERADRVRTLREGLKALAGQLREGDVVSVVAFARTPRVWVDGLPGARAAELPELLGELVPEGGTNLGDALRAGYETARKHFLPEGGNHVVLLTDGAANLGEVNPAGLRSLVTENRARGIALNCFGVGWEGYNDALLEQLSRNGDGRYGFVNSPEEAESQFVAKLAGALQVAAADVKVQVEFNPSRVRTWRQVGYAQHQLTTEQFRDNTVDAAEIGAAEAGNALYFVETIPDGVGPIGQLRVRYRVPDTGQYEEHDWAMPYTGPAVALEQASPSLRLAAVAGGFAEWLTSNPYAADMTPSRLLPLLDGAPESFAPDPRPQLLQTMLGQAISVGGR